METQLSHKKGEKALYLQIKDIYREKILSGELKNGDRVDSEMEIQKRYGVSRITARQAILDLEKEGMVNRGRGKGTFVTWSTTGNALGPDSLSRAVRYAGIQKGHCECHAEIRKIHPEIGLAFGLSSSQNMYCFKRIQKSSTMNLFYAETYYPGSLPLPELTSRSSRDLLSIAEEITKKEAVHVEEEIGAQIPSERICLILGITHNIPVLTRKRVVRGNNGKELEYTMAYYRSDLCSMTQGVDR